MASLLCFCIIPEQITRQGNSKFMAYFLKQINKEDMTLQVVKLLLQQIQHLMVDLNTT